MISAILLLDRNGDILVMRNFRKDSDVVAIDNYRIGVVAAKEITSPLTLIDESSFLHYVENDIYYVAVTRQNANACTIFEFLARLPRIFMQVFDLKEINPTEIKKCIPDIIELFDEMVDHGYLQNTDPEALRLLTQRQSASTAQSATESQITRMATGAISWRASNIVYKTNSIYVDVIEKVSLCISSNQKTLESSVNGNIMMKCYLSGMPECKIRFNEKVSVDGPSKSNSGIEVDDMVFHQCVKLANFSKDRSISFTPPDGEFELMRYRKTENVGVPFTINPIIRDLQGKGLEIRVNVRAIYDMKLTANPLILTIPLPQNTAEVEVTSSTGRAKYSPEQNAVIWRSTAFVGKSTAEIIIALKCLPATSRALPATKLTEPITAEFNISMFSASGLALKYLKVIEKSGYPIEKWLRYATKAGKYEIYMT
ncbi:Adaptor complexes medium subunit family protein [Tritrichomonas foetus]|uniref:Adaptor complexes medium subunit family protein n=1 Tax=Tritrichomonas foetus TaxID=1144522 RepID=A0A1J4J757_9EUKA|nr:Adaptor complexes medium subunit family protein [Tritrichomonas foetus]|eukprot:OHS95066.1 Adaptor complexes medium subunit family protein [Tritrichomonas foetus]